MAQNGRARPQDGRGRAEARGEGTTLRRDRVREQDWEVRSRIARAGAQSCLIAGPAGVGKSFITCALAHQACRENFSVRYLRLPRLLNELTIARGDGRYRKLLASLARTDLIVLDDFGLAALAEEGRRDLLEILEDRYQRRSTIVTNQFSVEHWHELINDPTLADAILDRLVHQAYRLALKGNLCENINNPWRP